MIRKVEMADVEVLAKIAKQAFRETFAYDNTEEQLQEYFEEAYSLKTVSTELEILTLKPISLCMRRR